MTKTVINTNKLLSEMEDPYDFNRNRNDNSQRFATAGADLY